MFTDLSSSGILYLVAPVVIVAAAAAVKWIEKSVEDPSEAMKTNFVGNRHVRCTGDGNASFGSSSATSVKVEVKDSAL